MALTSSREGTALPLSRLQPHFLSWRRERKGCQQARPGAFRRFPPPPPPLHSKSALPLPGQSGTHLLSPLGPETSNESEFPPPHPALHRGVGEGEAAEPLPWPRQPPMD